MRKSFTRHLLAGAAVTAILLSQAGMAGAHGWGNDNRHGWGHGGNKWSYWHGKGDWHKKRHHKGTMSFQRVATFPVFLNSDIDNQTVSEIVAASRDGRTLVYTDSPLEAVGFVDISNPERPQPLGTVDLPGEPTSVAVWKQYALVAVNTSDDYVTTSGQLVVVDIASKTIVHSIPLDGQPDSVAVSKDDRYAAVAIENERDEDLGDGEPPQAPAGYVTIIDTVGNPATWTTRDVSLVGIPDLFPEDPEPEYVSINDDNLAVVTLQENNHIALIDLASGTVVEDFSAGTVDLDQIDNDEDDIINMVDSLSDIPREPDGVVWVDRNHFVTADEGDLYGGSRGFTMFNRNGDVTYSSGNTLDHMAARIGHYPEGRSENKGVEPENVSYGQFGRDRLLFVNSERASIVYVYKLNRWTNEPEFMQALPAGAIGPEGGLAIPQRNLFITASEEDERGDLLFRGGLTIFRLERGEPTYPYIESVDRADGTPIPWAGLSGLVTDPEDETIAYTMHDSVYENARIYVLDISEHPWVIVDEIVIDGADDLDLEGITVAEDGTFWLASEGKGSRDNLLVHVAADGTALESVDLPDSVKAAKIKNGFEGLAIVEEDGSEVIYVAFQREWDTDPEGLVRIGRYDTATSEWTFAYYPLETPSPLASWVGLSELTAIGNGQFAVIERDNQGGADARTKLITRIDVTDVEFKDDSFAGAFDVLPKVIARDMIAKDDLTKAGGQVLEKLEGLAVTRNGTAIVVNDNDGVDDVTGETQVYTIERLFQQKPDRPRHPVLAWFFAWLHGWR